MKKLIFLKIQNTSPFWRFVTLGLKKCEMQKNKVEILIRIQNLKNSKKCDSGFGTETLTG